MLWREKEWQTYLDELLSQRGHKYKQVSMLKGFGTGRLKHFDFSKKLSVSSVSSQIVRISFPVKPTVFGLREERPPGVGERCRSSLDLIVPTCSDGGAHCSAQRRGMRLIQYSDGFLQYIGVNLHPQRAASASTTGHDLF